MILFQPRLKPYQSTLDILTLNEHNQWKPVFNFNSFEKFYIPIGYTVIIIIIHIYIMQFHPSHIRLLRQCQTTHNHQTPRACVIVSISRVNVFWRSKHIVRWHQCWNLAWEETTNLNSLFHQVQTILTGGNGNETVVTQASSRST